jgi:enamine deaminase RidA (YjgF/YER057c/UK114 family)
MNNEPRPQWLPLSDVAQPFKRTLQTLYPVAPHTFIEPAQFQLSIHDGELLWVSGQVPRFNQEIRYTGIVGEQLSVDQARDAARLCMANFLSIVAAACNGDLSRVAQVIRITGYVRGTADFGAHSQVIDGASDVLIALFGDRGRHARSAIGVHSLPGGAAVEIEGLVRLLS